MVAAQLVDWSFLTPVICGLNPVIDKIVSTNFTLEKEKDKEKVVGNGSSYKKYGSAHI